MDYPTNDLIKIKHSENNKLVKILFWITNKLRRSNTIQVIDREWFLRKEQRSDSELEDKDEKMIDEKIEENSGF